MPKAKEVEAAYDDARSRPFCSDEAAVRRDVEAALRLFAEKPVDVTQHPNALKNIKFSHVSAEGMQSVVSRICASLDLTQMREHSYSHLQDGKFIARCSRNGTPKPRTSSGGHAPSPKCGCKFRFALRRDGFIEIHQHNAEEGLMHAERCRPITDGQMKCSTRMQNCLWSPNQYEAKVQEKAKDVRDDGNLRSRNLFAAGRAFLSSFLPRRLKLSDHAVNTLRGCSAADDARDAGSSGGGRRRNQ